MKRDHQSVFFLRELTPEEEYDLIFPNQQTEEKKEMNQLIFGNKLLPTLSGNLRISKFTISEGERIGTSLVEMVLQCLLSNSIFYQMIEDSDEKINHKSVYTPFLSKLNQLRIKNQMLDFSDITGDTIQIFRKIIKKIHDDFIKTHFFEQEDWNTKKKTTYKFDKKLFEKYSPAVEIFHGEYEGIDRLNQPFKIMKDMIQIDSSNDNNNSLNDLIKQSLENEKLFIKKYPLILTIISNPHQHIILSDFITIDRKKYYLTAFITKSNSLYQLFMRINNIWYYSIDGVIHKYDSSIDQVFNTCISFYQMDKMVN